MICIAVFEMEEIIMLSSILDKEVCANCKNCCVFYEESRWEMPKVSEHKGKFIRNFLKDQTAVLRTPEGFRLKSVERKERLDPDSEEYRCIALNEQKGCTLPIELRPMECRMWPLRVMDDNGRIYIALAQSCSAVSMKFKMDVIKLLNDNLKDEIIELIKAGKHIIRKFEPSYKRLIEITEDVKGYE